MGLGAVAAVAVLYFGIMWLTLWRFQVSTDNAAVQADIATISAKLSGYVAEVKVTDNETVRRGQILMTLDTTDIEPRVAAPVPLASNAPAPAAPVAPAMSTAPANVQSLGA